MCFAREVLERFPWTMASLTEDAEYQALLLREGIRVTFVPDALSYGEIPTSLAAARKQRSRWMYGRAEVARRLAPVLLHSGLRRRSLVQLDGVIEQVMPSYSTLLMLCSLVALIGGSLDLLVGGFVRDLLLDQESKDYDVEVYGLPIEQLEKVLARFGEIIAVLGLQ